MSSRRRWRPSLRAEGGADPMGASRPMRRLVLSGSARERGWAHGERYRDEIRAYAEDRVALSAGGQWAGRSADRDEILALADSMLPAHRAYSPDLTEEMEAMAEACDLSPAEAVIVGGFTDFVDAVRALQPDVPEEDDCTAMLVPPSLGAEERGYLAQTWDMHESATEHVALLDIQPAEGPRAFVFSTVGCLGQIGLNEAGIAVGINNLSAAEGTRGVTWPFVVRQALAQSNLEDALKAVLDAPLAGAHHYLLMDRSGRGYDIEAMPQGHALRKLEQEPLVHTNHCVSPTTQAWQAPKAEVLMSSSQARLTRAIELLSGDAIGVAELMEITRDPEAICQVARPPYHIESSGAAVMSPATGELWAVWGLPSENEYDHFEFSDE